MTISLPMITVLTQPLVALELGVAEEHQCCGTPLGSVYTCVAGL